MELNDFFEGVYCINLDRRNDRWASAFTQFEKNNIKVERFSAIDGDEVRQNRDALPNSLIGRPHWIEPHSGWDPYPAKIWVKSANRWGKMTWGAVGLNLTRIKLLLEAKKKNLESIIMFEDDVLFSRSFERKFFFSSERIPREWDFLYLGGFHETGLGEKIFDGFYRCKWTLTTHAIGIHSRMYDKILEELQPYNMRGDVFFADMHSKGNSYTFYPFLATQSPGYSDIEGKDRPDSHWIQ